MSDYNKFMSWHQGVFGGMKGGGVTMAGGTIPLTGMGDPNANPALANEPAGTIYIDQSVIPNVQYIKQAVGWAPLVA